MHHEFAVRVEVKDEEKLLRTVAGLDREVETVEEALEELVSAERPPVDTGFEIVRIDVGRDGGDFYVVEVRCDVSDEAAVMAEAERRVQAVWDQRLEMPTAAHALYEILVASNDMPPNADLGIEVVRNSLDPDPVTIAPRP